MGAPRVLALGLAAFVGIGCSSAKMAGGKPVIPGRDPDGTELGAWRTQDCRDRAGAVAIDPGARVRLVRTEERKVFLVDSRAGYDTVVSGNGEQRGSEWIFDVALKAAHGEPRLRQYRLPAKFDGPGRYLLATVFEDEETDDGFRARVTSPAIECTLARAGL